MVDGSEPTLVECGTVKNELNSLVNRSFSFGFARDRFKHKRAISEEVLTNRLGKGSDEFPCSKHIQHLI
jgi:hypothetical protein